MAASGDSTKYPFAPPRRREWIVIVTIATVLMVYLPIVIHRTVIKGFGDVQVFFRAAWAIWTGFPLYEVVDVHGWSYHYPPSFALVMAPFANAPPGYTQPAWALPYPAAVGVWYMINAVALLVSLHVWASALERSSGRAFRAAFWQPSWALRLGPLLALLPFAGDGLGRGQPTALLGLLMIGFLVFYVNGRHHAAALLLAIAATIKIYPIALAFIPLLRRDLRTLLFLAGWCVILLVGPPIVCLGPEATWELYRTLWVDRLAGIVTGTPQPRIAAEVSPWSYDMGSIGSMLARVFTPDLPKQPMPLPDWAKLGQLAANLTIITMLAWLGHGRFWRFGKNQPDDPYPVLSAGAVLMAALPLMLTTSQPNYLTHAIPLVAVLLLEAWRRTGQAIISPAMVFGAAAAWFAMIATDVHLWEPLNRLNPNTLLLLGLVGAGFVAMARYGNTAIRPARTWLRG